MFFASNAIRLELVLKFAILNVECMRNRESETGESFASFSEKKEEELHFEVTKNASYVYILISTSTPAGRSR